MYPFLFHPNLHSVVWGGHQLQPYKGLEPSEEPIGESWEVSAVPTSTSIIANGPLVGRDLVSVISEYPEAILGKAVNEKYKGQLPLLVKFIDAKRDLSIQVHPNDEMAQREHGKMGKSEMWYIIKADAGAHLYAGFKQEITPAEYQQRIQDGTITEVLADHQVKAGDVFYLPAGRVHAICGGILRAWMASPVSCIPSWPPRPSTTMWSATTAPSMSRIPIVPFRSSTPPISMSV